MASQLNDFISKWRSDEKFREEFRKNPAQIVGRFNLSEDEKKMLINSAKLPDKELEERISKRR